MLLAKKSILHAAIRSTVVCLSSLTFIFHLTALFSCPWQPNTSQTLHMWWSHCGIYRLAGWGKAVCMLGSPGEFTAACTSLSASSDTVAFQAEETMQSDSQRAFCPIQQRQNRAFHGDVKTFKDSGPTCFSERKYCCHTGELTWMLAL